MIPSKTRASLCILGAFMIAYPAQAQLSAEGGRTQISADRLDVAERESTAVYVGAVDAIQGDARLRADKLTINFSGTDDSPEGGGFGSIETMLADGDVFYITPDLSARGDTGNYDADTEIITLTGNVVISRGSDIAQGDCLSLNVPTGESTLGCSAPGEGGQRGRVTTVITPGTNNSDG